MIDKLFFMCSQLCLRQRVSVVTGFPLRKVFAVSRENDSLHGRDQTFSPVMRRLRRLASTEKSRFHKVTMIVR